MISFLFFFNDTATTEIYTLSLHDALPISDKNTNVNHTLAPWVIFHGSSHFGTRHWHGRVNFLCQWRVPRSEEHTSELQSHSDLVCRLLLEKKKKKQTITHSTSTRH